MSECGQAIAERGRLHGGHEIDPHMKTAIQTVLARSAYVLAYMVLDWMIITTAVSAFLVATTHIGLIILAGLLTTADFAVTTVSYWIGEAIGIVVVTPVALLLCTKRYAVWGSVVLP